MKKDASFRCVLFACVKTLSFRGRLCRPWESPARHFSIVGVDRPLYPEIATPVCALARNDILFFAPQKEAAALKRSGQIKEERK